MIEFMRSISNAVGITGVTFILIAYFLINTNRLTAKSLSYLILNFIGAWLILFSLCFHWNLASVMIECAWILISIMGIYRIIRQRNVSNI